MSTHNICFRGEIRKIFTGYPPLSRPMECKNEQRPGGYIAYMHDDLNVHFFFCICSKVLFHLTLPICNFLRARSACAAGPSQQEFGFPPLATKVCRHSFASSEDPDQTGSAGSFQQSLFFYICHSGFFLCDSAEVIQPRLCVFLIQQENLISLIKNIDLGPVVQN